MTDNAQFASVSKAKASLDFGGGTDAESDDIRIIQIDEDGESLETWTLKHAWIKEVTFGDLDYGSEDLTEVTVKFRYDWATFESGAPVYPQGLREDWSLGNRGVA